MIVIHGALAQPWEHPAPSPERCLSCEGCALQGLKPLGDRRLPRLCVLPLAEHILGVCAACWWHSGCQVAVQVRAAVAQGQVLSQGEQWQSSGPAPSLGLSQRIRVAPGASLRSSSCSSCKPLPLVLVHLNRGSFSSNSCHAVV